MEAMAAKGPVPIDLSESTMPPTAPQRRLFVVACGLLLLSLGSFLVLDHTLAGSLKARRYHGELTNLLDAVEHFGTPYGATLLLVTMWLCTPEHRRKVSRTAVAAISAGLVADIGKLLITRVRPDTFDFQKPIEASIEGFLRWGRGGSRFQSFPSAHTAFAIAFAVMLGALFPKARGWFLVIGALVAVQRIVATAHYPSDVLAGAAVGCVIAGIFMGPSPISRLYDRLEERYFPQSTSSTDPLSR